jgi:GNAT superfamily N-acetyltransferase
MSAALLPRYRVMGRSLRRPYRDPTVAGRLMVGAMTDTGVIREHRVDPALTYALRQRVLRPHQQAEDLRLPGDGDPDTGTFAALTADGEVAGTATVRPEPCPWRPDEAGAWRLRGMATAPELRGRGIGERVLAAALDHVAIHGGALVWCNARTPALSFYRRAGFETFGDEWVDPEIGPHVRMWRPIGG